MRPDYLTPLFRSVRSFKGVGAQIEALLKKFFALNEEEELIALDLLMHMPSQIIDRRRQVSVLEAQIGEIVTLKLHIDEHIEPIGKDSKTPYKILAHDNSSPISLVFFHYPKNWLKRSLPIGQIRYVSGRIGYFNNEKQITHPDYIVAERDLISLPLVEPIYPLTSGLSAKVLRKIIVQAANNLPQIPDWIDEKRLSQFGWPSFSEAMKQIHLPDSPSQAEINSKARMRLAYDEYFASQLTMQIIRSNLMRERGIERKFSGKIITKLKNALPFTLTRGQEKAIEEILHDLRKKDKMARLLQGDVGSGKTIIALMAMAAIAESGAQSALMAPTEILAKQHYKSLKPLCDKVGLNIALLSGKQTKAERKPILAEIKNGKVNIIIGTHALFQTEVEFNNLGLSIIDEQHRFGVYQRLALSKKGKMADLLVMSATPIPRSLVLTHFGDMDISILREKPVGRREIKTAALPISKYEPVIERLKRQINEGAQAFWVCPLIEESEYLDLVSAQNRFIALKKIFGEQVALVHGKIRSEEKQQIMEDFLAGKIKILVATTVIEVGVNVPNASIMIIEHAERFGLSQLHQLRGRVGRSTKESACLLLYKPPLGDIARARIDIICKSQDGFEIAEKDLQLRGQGDILGARQSGMPGYRLVIPDIHQSLLQYAHIDAKQLIREDGFLNSERGKTARACLYIFRKEQAIKLIKAG